MNIVSRGFYAVAGACLIATSAWAQQAPQPQYPAYPQPNIRTAQAPQQRPPVYQASSAPGGAVPTAAPAAAPNGYQPGYAGQPGAVQPGAPMAGPGVRPAAPGAPAGPVQGGPRPAPVAMGPLLPAWADKLPPAHQEYLDRLLVYWEFKSKQVNKFRCDFERWEFDRQFGPKEADGRPIAATYGTGTIKYERPDKGSFKVEQLGFYTPPKAAGAKPTYDARPNEFGDHWVCDGKSVFEFLPLQKIMRETQLPLQMQGQAIANGPLPFMFGAQADKLKRRYAMQVITPGEAKDQYWIEAWPRTRADAENFRFVEVIISAKDYLPEAMRMYGQNGSWTVFSFHERKVNGALDNIIAIWPQAFIKPELPAGWKREVVNMNQPQPMGPQPGPGQFQPGVGPQAVRPTGAGVK